MSADMTAASDKTLFGLSVKVMDWLPANSFVMVSRVSVAPAVFHVLSMSEGGEIKEWRGTLSEAWDVIDLGTKEK